MSRGVVLGLSLAEVAQRARYLAGEVQIGALDSHVRRSGAPSDCPVGYYLLKEHNGGKDPTAPDPFDRWTKQGGSTVNRTADCIGGAAWCGGFDRYQPERFKHIYSGWINTDSMRLDAGGPAKCFERLARPEPGCFVVFASGAGGHRVGHIGTVVDVPAEWDGSELECWKLLGVVDVAARQGRANRRTTGATWAGKSSWFIRSTMQP